MTVSVRPALELLSDVPPTPRRPGQAEDARSTARRFLTLEEPEWAGPTCLASPTSGLTSELLLVEELQGRSLAPSTRRHYAGHVEAWIAWCETRGVDALPASPSDVAAHVATYGVLTGTQGRPLRDESGELQKGAAPVSVDVRLAAIDKLHEFAGHPRPGSDETVRRVMRGLRRSFGVRPERARDALDWDRLGRVLALTRTDDAPTRRRRAVLVARARLGATAGQLARLTWPAVNLLEDRVDVLLPPTRRGGVVRLVSVPRSRHVLTCLATALETLADGADGLYVFTEGNGAPLTRQAIHLQIAGIEAAGGGRLDELSEARLNRLLESVHPGRGGGVAGARNASLLLTGWFGALRRSNLVGLQWRDVTELPGGDVRLTLRFSKTNQTGEVEYVFLPCHTADPSRCPVTALAEWRRHVARAVGGDPAQVCPTAPVYAPVDRHGRIAVTRTGVPRRLSGEAVNEIVARLSVAAGLSGAADNQYGGHSLRVGFVTEALRRGMTVPEIMQVTKHRDARTVHRYGRAENLPENNPARSLLSRLA